MTRSPANRQGVHEVTSKEDALDEAILFSEEINIIGGEFIYKEFLPIATKLLITEVDLEVESPDAYFPVWRKEDWIEVSSRESQENGIKFNFVEYVRN